MNFAVLGTGIVGRTIGSALVQRGHNVMMGSRTPDNPKATEWAADAGGGASHGTFEDAARFGEVVLNCTAGRVSIEALRMVGAEALGSKILIDLANPLDFSRGMPPSLTVCNTDSLAEQIQREFPEAKVIKTLNTMNCSLMVHPGRVPGDHNVFVSGNDAEARKRVVSYLADWFGWKKDNIIDLGDLSSARGTEMLLPVWVQLMSKLKHANFNFHIVVADAAAGHGAGS